MFTYQTLATFFFMDNNRILIFPKKQQSSFESSQYKVKDKLPEIINIFPVTDYFHILILSTLCVVLQWLSILSPFLTDSV